MTVDCAVLVVTHNSAADLPGLLRSLPAAAPGLTLRTVVVDNASTDGTLDVARAAGGHAVDAGGNLGYAAGVNLAAAHAGPARFRLVLNPDLVLEPDAISRLVAAAGRPGVGVAVPLVLDPAGRPQHSLRREPSLSRAVGDALFGDRWPNRPARLSEVVRDTDAYATPGPVDWATGAAMLVSAGCAAAVGAWDERFFLYSEEVDYAARVRSAGYRVAFVPTARVRHRGGGSGASADLVALMAVNRIRYVAKRGRGAGAYRAAVALHELLRSADPEHRHALRTVLRRSRWHALPAGGPR